MTPAQEARVRHYARLVMTDALKSFAVYCHDDRINPDEAIPFLSAELRATVRRNDEVLGMSLEERKASLSLPAREQTINDLRERKRRMMREFVGRPCLVCRVVVSREDRFLALREGETPHTTHVACAAQRLGLTDPTDDALWAALNALPNPIAALSGAV